MVRDRNRKYRRSLLKISRIARHLYHRNNGSSTGNKSEKDVFVIGIEHGARWASVLLIFLLRLMVSEGVNTAVERSFRELLLFQL